ncbi:MAG: hypothetical protein LBJ18_03725 [Rickettsiales bacterium]|jgi:hypothetical protein|nr:hypothetical protein [Rickettsiales bacterium]
MIELIGFTIIGMFFISIFIFIFAAEEILERRAARHAAKQTPKKPDTKRCEFGLCVLLACALGLSACGTTPPSKAILDNAGAQIENVKKQVAALPTECNAQPIIAQLDAIAGAQQAAAAACESEKAPIRKDIWIWRLISGFLATIIAAFVVYKVIKK